MRKSIFGQTKMIVLSLYLLGLLGCGSIAENLPASPGFLSKIELNGPYDGDIPPQFITRIKRASLMSDWAVPHLFINLGMYFESCDDELRAVHFLDRASAEFHKRGNTPGEGIALNHKVAVLCRFGKNQEAESAIKEAEKKWPDAEQQSFISYNYGQFYLINGDYKKGQKYFRKSLQSNQNFRADFNMLMLRRDTELGCGESIILADYVQFISDNYYLLDFDDAFYTAIRKNVDEGIAHLNQVSALNHEIRKTKIGRYLPEIDMQIMEVKAHHFLGLSYGIKGQLADALKNIEAALQLAKKADYRLGEVDNIFFLSHVHLLGKNIDAGQKAAEQLDEIASKNHLPFYFGWAKIMLYRHCLSRGDLKKATDFLKDALAIMEKPGFEREAERFKGMYASRRRELYETLIELLIKQGNYRGSFETAERAKAWVIANLISGVDIGKTPSETELLQRIEVNRKYRAAGYRKLFASAAGGSASYISALGLITKAENAIRDATAQIKLQNEELFSLISIEPLDSGALQRLLDGNTTLFSYYSGDKILYVWAVNKNRIHLERIKMSRQEVAALVSSFHKAIASRDRRRAVSSAEIVYDTFLKPIMPYVSGDRIGFIPHDSLHDLPFAAMNYVESYLVDGFSIFYLPNAGVLKYIVKKNPLPGTAVAVFANPDLGKRELKLSHTEAEQESIRKNFPRTSFFLQKEATKAKIKEIVSDCTLFHIAAPSYFMENKPLQSGFRLTPTASDDGLLSVREIFQLQFKGRAMVMSAYGSSPRSSSAGLEMVALNSACLYAGSPSVLAMLWDIGDRSKAIFMDIFYKKLNKSEPLADALKAAQNEMIIMGYDPYDWAAFVLTGKY